MTSNQPQQPKPPGSTVNPMALHYLEEERETQIEEKKSSNFTRYLAVFLGIGIGVLLIIGISLSSNASTSTAAEPRTPTEQEDTVSPVGEYAPRIDGTVRTTFVHLFEWKWTDIEKECVNYLGPLGYSAVQVSPVNEHVNHKSIPNNPWWTRYQPVSYKIESRSGTREEFARMVQTCKSVGVDIYVDAVLNHMGAASTGVGNAGTPYDPNSRQYSKFGPNDFNYCNPADISGSDYQNDAYRVRYCQLVGLPDLNQDSSYVRSVQADFLQDLLNLGVSGFRLDAAKHMVPNNINQILNQLSSSPYVFGEVIDYGGESISETEYTPFYDVTEFRYEKKLVTEFTSGALANLENIGESFGYMSSLKAVTFVDNHDTQRYFNAALTYRNGALYNLANVFLLGYSYGYPKVMSSYNFNQNDFDKGPPSDFEGNTRNVYNGDGSDNCFKGEWVCEHRYREIYNMVGFKNYVATQEAFDVSNWWSNGFQALAFVRSGNRGSAGFIVINKENFAINENWNTGLADGEYCDVFSGNLENGRCTGKQVTVSNGFVQTSVDSYTALVIHGGAKLF